MKKIILFLTLLTSLNIAIGKDIKVGYFVYVEKCGEVSELKTTDFDEAETFIKSFYPYFCEDLEYEFLFTPYYRVNAFKKEIYVEKMRINKRGKYKRLKVKQL